MGFDRWGDSAHKMTAFWQYSESTEMDLSFNELTEVRAGMWEVINRWEDSMCEKRNIPFCITPCFELYHTKDKYKDHGFQHH